MSRRFFRRLTDPKRRSYARFLGDVYSALNRAFIEEAERQRLSKAQLAERLGVDRAVVTRRLGGHGNMTLESLHNLAWAMDRRIEVSLPPLQGVERHSNAAVRVFSDLPAPEPQDEARIVQTYGDQVRRVETFTSPGGKQLVNA